MKLSLMLASLVFALPLALSSVAQAAPPTDPEIAHIVVTANTIDVKAGKLAVKKTKNKEVKEFAQQMVTDHSMVNKQAIALAKKLHVTPKANAVSKSLNEG